MNKNKFYITTPIYYINAKPHLGTLYSTVLADIAARWQKVCGKEVYFLTGTDEHGQKIQERAKQLGTEPKALADAMVPDFKKAWQLFEIEYDHFIRTTDPDHAQAVVAWITKMQEQGDIYKAEYVGWYCVPDETFVTNPVLTPDKPPLCPTCMRPLQELAQESYFFRLSGYESALLEFYEKNPHFIAPKERLNEVISFVKTGLKDLSISRKGVSWGIPFPGDPEHTVYVWADALNNYISAIGYGKNDKKSQDQFRHWWPADVQVMAKDIIRFHAVYWPAFLMAAGLELPKRLLVHGFILINDQKMSKSLGNAIDPLQLATTYGPEAIRYYLARHLSVTHDGSFDVKELENHINAELAYGIGNLLQRTITLALKNGLNEVKPLDAWEAESAVLREQCAETFRSYREEMEQYEFHVALQAVWKFINQVNAYFHEQQPWRLAKENKELFAEVISATCHSLYSIAVLLWPVMPKKMESLFTILGHEFKKGTNYAEQLRINKWNKTFNLTQPKEALFSKIETKEATMETAKSVVPVSTPPSKEEPGIVQKDMPGTPKKQTSIEPIDITQFTQVQLLVGEILACKAVPGSDKLYQLTVDMGEHGQRSILSGVAQHFKPEDLIGKKGVYVANLKPRMMLGLESQGMMLFAKDVNGKLVMSTVERDVPNGTRLT